MDDGFLLTDREWRITYANPAAERLLRLEGGLIGQPLWDAPDLRAVPGLETHCRQAEAGGTPTGFDTRWPGTDRWYHVRLVPVPEGLTLHLAEVTEPGRRRTEGEAAAVRAALTADLTHHLAEAVSVQDVVDTVARTVLHPLGAVGLMVQLVESDRLTTVGAVGYPAVFLDHIRDITLEDAAPPSHALATRTPQFIESPGEYIARYPTVAHFPALTRKRSWAFLPLFVSGRAIGAVVISFDHPRSFPADERTLLTAFSGLVAQALERARLYDDEHRRAQRLQTALLPRTLRPLFAVTAAARHRPAVHDADTGGHLCDVIRLPSERAALVVGAAQAGSGLDEAIIMGRLRTAVTTLTALDYQPDEMLMHLHDTVGAFAADLGPDAVLTCLYAVYDPADGVCSVASAGLQPPALGRDGAIETLPVETGPPLGTEQATYQRSEFVLPPGVPLLLHTVPGHALTTDWTRLAPVTAAATAFHTGSAPSGPPREAARLAALAEGVAAALPIRPSRLASAAAVMAVMPRRFAADSITEWLLPFEAEAARQARERVRDQLTVWGAEDLITTTELIVSELVGNAIRYAAPLPGDVLRLRLLRATSVTCELADGSESSPRIRHPGLLDETGRGLQLVAAMSHQWGSRFTQEGKVIWSEQPLP
ncbi:SpoIIE family protein phosphatase [Streptomyces sp. URMC 129]|uniref:SpoIIE family protein phosphatase n=1 Tax=Streptomyces sp. URMC 129 TaxID=3423407 RepID=UPI003F1A6500